MTFDLPNYADTAFPEQSRLYSSDLAILSQGYSLTGVKTGCAVTAQGSPNMTVAVAAGTIYWLFAEVAVTAGNVTITAANATNPRIDLVVVNSSGVKSVVAGTPAVVPTQPALPALSVALAQVFVPANDTTISTAQIKDRRMTLMVPSVAGGTVIVRKTASETVASSTTLQDDNHLFFAMSANGIWAVKLVVMGQSAPAGGGSINVSFSAPSGAVWRMLHIGGSGTTAALASDGPTQQVQTGPLPTSGAVAFMLEGIVSTAATSGDFRFRWAQAVSSANGHTILPNSYLEYRLLT